MFYQKETTFGWAVEGEKYSHKVRGLCENVLVLNKCSRRVEDLMLKLLEA